MEEPDFVTRRYVSPEYEVNPATGEVIVHYLFGGRRVATATTSQGLRYLLSDHLSSSHAEVGTDQAELGQRRYYPYGSDRPVSGAGDLSGDPRYAAQRRADAGSGNVARELYQYGARWHLPDIGIFTQPDLTVPDLKNPQSLNRFSYGYGNPLRYKDSGGYEPIDQVTPVAQPAPTPAPSLTATPTPTPAPSASPSPSPTPTPAPAPTPAGTSSIGGGIDWGAFGKAASDAAGYAASAASGLTWNGGNTVLGLTLGGLGRLFGGSVRTTEGGNVIVFENVQGPARWLVQDLLGRNNPNDPNAVTLGHVILNAGAFDNTSRGQWWYAHERTHVLQGDLMGPLYLVLYGVGYLLPPGIKHDDQFMEAWANETAADQVPAGAP